MFERIEVIGNVGRIDFKESVGKNGNSVLTVSVASNRGDGNKRDTNWYSVDVWGSLGEAVYKFLKVGAVVFVGGEPSYRTYIDKNGEPRVVLQILARDFRVIRNGGDNHSYSTQSDVIDGEYVDGSNIDHSKVVF